MSVSQHSLSREEMRLAALYSLTLSCDDQHHIFERFVHLASDVFAVSAVAISIIDAENQIYFAKTGLDGDGTTRADAICSVTVTENRTLLIPDTTADPRWRSRSFVIGPPGVRFYAGTPVYVRGQPIGTFCLVDTKPHHSFDESDLRLLESFAAIVADLLEMQQLRRASRDQTAPIAPSTYESAA